MNIMNNFPQNMELRYLSIQRILYTIWFLISNDNVRFVTLKIHSDAIEVATVTACILYNDFTVISLLLCANANVM